MKYAFSLESVNMLTSGPNFIYKQSRAFWVNYFKYISVAGFRAIELPFNPFSSDPMAFETGRCGIPVNAGAINSKYGSPKEFREFLKGIGIEDICSIHVNANDAMLELVAAAREPEDYYTLLAQMLDEALAHAKSLDCPVLAVSPSPEIGWINRVFGADRTEEFAKKTEQILTDAVAKAKDMNIAVALRNEYWSVFRTSTTELAKKCGAYVSTDPANAAIAGLDPAGEASAAGTLLCVPKATDTAFEDKFENYARINAELPVEGPQKVFADLGEGKVDLEAYCRAVEEAGYDGYMVCEQRKTLDVYRGLLKCGWFAKQ